MVTDTFIQCRNVRSFAVVCVWGGGGGGGGEGGGVAVSGGGRVPQLCVSATTAALRPISVARSVHPADSPHASSHQSRPWPLCGAASLLAWLLAACVRAGRLHTLVRKHTREHSRQTPLLLFWTAATLASSVGGGRSSTAQGRKDVEVALCMAANPTQPQKRCLFRHMRSGLSLHTLRTQVRERRW
jgi:hypothetical protein